MIYIYKNKIIIEMLFLSNLIRDDNIVFIVFSEPKITQCHTKEYKRSTRIIIYNER
jgi:hypothetical protein